MQSFLTIVTAVIVFNCSVLKVTAMLENNDLNENNELLDLQLPCPSQNYVPRKLVVTYIVHFFCKSQYVRISPPTHIQHSILFIYLFYSFKSFL